MHAHSVASKFQIAYNVKSQIKKNKQEKPLLLDGEKATEPKEKRSLPFE